MALSGNKGEWSEVYTLFKLLGDKKVFAGDGNLNKIEDLFYPIIKILRQEENTNYEFAIHKGDIVIVTGDGKKELRIPVAEFTKQAKFLLNIIKKSAGAFTSPETEQFMRSAYCTKIKAKSSDKTDIKIIIHDLHTGVCPTLGFSIKSKMGGASTLINPSRATNFRYTIGRVKLTQIQIDEINSIETKSKIRDRILRIKELGALLTFDGIDSPVFNNNLIMIDSFMPNIMGELLLMYYSGEGKLLNKLSERLQQTNPLGYDMRDKHKFYEYKLKRLLCDAALGMTPAHIWTGIFDANGGYLVVKKDGDVLCYHIYKRNEFENYLLNTSFMDTPSSTRYRFGIVENIGEKQILKLNLQIRFI
ncbi:type II restriction endonuclease HpaII [Bacteroidales bacterium]|nr:type II restriction endonuclease HpaII [Bacteroidales bacterium]